MRPRLVLLLAAAAFGAPAAAHAAPPAIMAEELLRCGYEDADYVHDHRQAAFTADPECLYQAHDGFATIEPSTLKAGQTATLTWHPGTLREQATVGGWWTTSNEYYFRAAVGRFIPDQTPDKHPQALLVATNSDSCFHASTCEVRLQTPYSNPWYEGYLKAQIGYETDTAGGGAYDLQIKAVLNKKPVADFAVRRVEGLRYEIDGSATIDDSGVKDWEWRIGSGGVDELPNQAKFTYDFPEPGNYLIGLTAWDEEGESSELQQMVEITARDEPPPPPPPDGGGGTAPPPSGVLPAPAAPLVPAAPPAPPTPSPAAGVAGLPSAARPSAKGTLSAGRASNPPTSSTTQKLVLKGKTLARGATAIPAGAARPLKLKLTKAGRKALKRKRKIAATLVVSARGADGKVAEIRSRLALRRR